VAHNEVGSMSSEWISFITQKECEYKKLLPWARKEGGVLFFLSVLGFELRASSLLSRCSTL
jgi:hypothetical protein